MSSFQAIHEFLASSEGSGVLDVIASIALKHGREGVAMSTLRRATTLELRNADDLYVFL